MNEELLGRINLLPRAQAISAGDSVFSAEQREFIAELYQSLLGKEIRNCSCRNRYSDALEEICLTFKIKLTITMKCKYQLLAGVIIWLGTECYNNQNLTDEVAEEYLALHPDALEKEFQVWPKERENAAEKVQAAIKTLEESEAGLKESEAKLKEESVADIVAHQDTLREVIKGGNILNIVSAEEGLREAWEHAEAKPVVNENPEDAEKGETKKPAEKPSKKKGE